ncbi:MAG: class I SAM-dependent methyltransferase [Xanthobacteraceae bacterium]
MSELNRQAHWQLVYKEKGENQFSWFQERPNISLALIEAVQADRSTAIIDIGGGASRLVDALVEKGYRDLTVLDLSESAVSIAKMRLGERAAMVKWIVADVTRWEPPRSYDLWHDRAAFHFLTEASDRTAYIDRLRKAVRPGGHAIIGTFGLDGPERCSGLPVVRYDAARLSATLTPSFALVDMRRDDHKTPWGAIQHFQFSVFRRA